MTENTPEKRIPKTVLAGLVIVFLAGLLLRTGGLYRGLSEGYNFHPDEAKQVHALHDYLEGKYVRYHDSLFYDGYPFFLNHFDEWIIRALSPSIEAGRRHLHPDQKTPHQPEISELYYWARTLRVVYGMAVLLICFYAARKVVFSKPLSLLAVALLSLAPLSIVVTHSASGDIGVDLFLSAAILILSLHSGKPSRGLLFAAGFLVGFAFAAKYHGALGCLMIAMYCTFRLCSKQVNIKQFIADGLVSFLGFIISIHIAIPQLITAGDRTWSDIFKNLTFIKNYNVDSEILEKTALEQAWLGITRNAPYLISNLGPALMLLAAAGAVLITIKLFREAREEKNPQRVNSETPLLAAVIIFPFLASLISLLGKGKIQAFHFSYTLLPFIFAACYCVKRMFSAKNAFIKGAAALLIIMSLAQALSASLNENFFWRKDDTEQLAHVFAKNILHSTPSHISARVTSAASRNFDLENFNPSTFRNRDRGVIFATSPFWNKIKAAPAPCVPFAYETDWIFTEGPTFPRNDRMFKIRPGKSETKHIIMHSKPENITLGIRTGSLPALLEISSGKKKQKTNIEPDSQEILTMEAGKWKHIDPRKDFTELDRDIYLVPLEIRSELGNAWVTVLNSERDITRYKAFGGDPKSFKKLRAENNEIDTICGELNKALFLSGTEPYSADTSGAKPKFHILPQHTVLPCGVYKLQLTFTDITEPAQISVRLVDHRNMSKTFSKEETFTLSKGTDRLLYKFAKPFSPHEINITYTCKSGKAALHRWELVPDMEAIVKDIQKFNSEKTPELWMKKFADDNILKPRSKNALGINMGSKYTLDRVIFPTQLKQGSDFIASVRMGMNKTPSQLEIEEPLLIFRIVPPSKQPLPHIATQLRNAFYHSDWEPPLLLSVDEKIQPGTYDVVVGVVNIRNDKKLRMKGPVIPEGHKRRESWYKIGKLEVVPSE